MGRDLLEAPPLCSFTGWVVRRLHAVDMGICIYLDEARRREGGSVSGLHEMSIPTRGRIYGSVVCRGSPADHAMGGLAPARPALSGISYAKCLTHESVCQCTSICRGRNMKAPTKQRRGSGPRPIAPPITRRSEKNVTSPHPESHPSPLQFRKCSAGQSALPPFQARLRTSTRISRAKKRPSVL